MDITKIQYRDLALREYAERERLKDRLMMLERSARSRSGAGVNNQVDEVFFSVDELGERDRIRKILKVIRRNSANRTEWADPLWIAARDYFNFKARFIPAGLQNPLEPVSATAKVTLIDQQGQLVDTPTVPLTVGILALDQVSAPPVVVDPRIAHDSKHDRLVLAKDVEIELSGDMFNDEFIINSDQSHPAWQTMSASFFKAIGEAESYGPLAKLVLERLGDVGGRTVDLAEYASVMRKLAARGITADEPQLGRRIEEALDNVQNAGGSSYNGYGDGPVETHIDLPNLESIGESDIVKDHVLLMGAVICGAMLDELKAFQAVDIILTNAQNGSLAISSGQASKLLYDRWKRAPNRMSEAERRDIYAMTMGQPGGNPGIQGNTEFNDLWIRFVSSVSSYVRQQDVDRLLRSALPSAVGMQQVRKAARDLSANLSLHGYGMTFHAALDLQGEVKSLIALLSEPEILSAYGAKNMWQVVDTIATTDLGGARTSSRYRTLATCGAIITAWLANNIEKVVRPTGTIIDMMDIRSPVPRTAGTKATSNPTDHDLVNACELWLADTAVSDQRVDELSQPRETPVMTSKPVWIPSFAREFMQDVPGMDSMGLGLRNGSAAAHRY